MGEVVTGGARFYEGIVDPKVEMSRLADLFPTRVSVGLIATELARVDGHPIVGDFGSGSNPALGRIVTDLGATYVPLDTNLLHLKALREGLPKRSVIGGNVATLPFPARSFNLTHTRAVLAFLRESDRLQAIREILRVTTDTAIFIEYDYETVKSWQGIGYQFGQYALQVLQSVGFDPYLGQQLETVVKSQLTEERPAQKLRVQITRTPGYYYDEMILRAEELSRVAEKMGLAQAHRELRVIAELIKQNPKGLPEFETPQATAVIVRFKSR